MRNNTAFLITAFDQLREVNFTVHLLRNIWKETQKSPVVIVISGDSERQVYFNHDPYTRVVHLDDMVGDKFKTLVSTSIMRQITHGMLEIKDLEREFGRIDNIIHMHGDILLLNEQGFFKELDRWKSDGRPIAADNVGAQHPVTKVINGKRWAWRFFGCELMPQLFAVDHAFCSHTGYMYDMEVVGDLERKATEWALIGNLHRTLFEHGSGKALHPVIDPFSDKFSPYKDIFEDNVYVVRNGRPQWGLHKHWGGFCHYGNSLHYTKEQREKANKVALAQYGIDLAKW